MGKLENARKHEAGRNVVAMTRAHNKGKVKDLLGLRFGRLAVLRCVAIKTEARWLCQCDCGNQITVRGSTLRNGMTKSCGCWRRDSARAQFTSHGETKDNRTTPEYHSWCNMRDRCLNPNNHAYADYGGRGIAISPRWSSFDNFLADMGRKPEATYSIERINNDGNYEPSNCRWASQSDQHRNRRIAKNIRLTETAVREIRSSSESTQVLASRYSVSPGTIRNAIAGRGRYASY